MHQPAPRISLLDVQARWASTEILDSNFERLYDNAYDIDALRQKRRNGLPFDQLTPQDRYSLAFQCYSVRPLLLA
jgi:hypothetical protein